MIKKQIKGIIAHLVYLLYKNKVLKTDIRVQSIDETIDELITTNKSMVRFGDGEMTMMMGKNLQLENHQQQLADSMMRIIGYEHDNLMVAICNIFGNLDIYRKESQEFWKDHLVVRRKEYVKLCNPKKVYGNATISRCYYMYQDKSKCAEQFERIRQIWKDKDIVVVEGSRTHNGVGNDLLDTAKSVVRIIGPSKDAYLRIEQIYEECCKFSKEHLILISLGAAAKPLTERLYLEGYRVLDIGNLDMEYEWFLMKAKTKVKISKHEVVGEEANRKAGYEKYLNEIKVMIES